MATHSSSNRDAIRTFVVVALSLLVLVAGGMDFRRVWTPIGVFGFQANGDEEVIFVLDGSPAAKAGMQVGDIIDLRSTPLQSKYFAVQAGTLTAGQSATFGVTHRGARRILTLTAIPQVTEAQPYYTVYRIAVLGVALLYIFLGAALVLLRPSLMTWGFFVYCLANAPFTFYSMALLYPFPWPYVAYAVQWCLIAAGTIGLLVFALCFLNENVKGWRFSALRTMPWLLAALVIFGLVWVYQWGWVGGPPGELFSRVYIGIQVLWSLAVLYLFLDTYVRARGADRQRIRWVVVGFGLNLVFQFVYQFLTLYAPSTPILVFHILQLSTVIVPLTVAYAVIKHRVIDVSFVVSRPLVYGVLTSLLVGAFALVDWIFMDKLKLARLGAVAEMGVAVAGGFWFNGLHKRVDSSMRYFSASDIKRKSSSQEMRRRCRLSRRQRRSLKRWCRSLYVRYHSLLRRSFGAERMERICVRIRLAGRPTISNDWMRTTIDCWRSSKRSKGRCRFMSILGGRRTCHRVLPIRFWRCPSSSGGNLQQSFSTAPIFTANH